jgi:hypothetical protein
VQVQDQVNASASKPISMADQLGASVRRRMSVAKMIEDADKKTNANQAKGAVTLSLAEQLKAAS